MLVTRKDGKRMFTGVVREDDGDPPCTGCIRLDYIFDVGVESESVLALSGTAYVVDEVATVEAAAMAKVHNLAAVECTVRQAENGEHVPVTTAEEASARDAKRKAEIVADAKEKAKKKKEIERKRSAGESEASESDEEINYLEDDLLTGFSDWMSPAKSKGASKFVAPRTGPDGGAPKPGKPQAKKAARTGEKSAGQG